MKQWEIYYYDFPAPIGRHPAVVISNNALCNKGKAVNILLCTSVRGGQQASVTQAILNGADGLENLTLVQCDQIYLVRKDELTNRLGIVSPGRRRQIAKIIATLLNAF